MLQDLEDSEFTSRFVQALYNLEGWDILGVKYEIPESGFVKSPTEKQDLVECWGILGFVEDWFICRTKPDNLIKSSTLLAHKCQSRRRRSFSVIYKCGNSQSCEAVFNCHSFTQKAKSPYTWNDYLVTYLDKRRVERLTRLSRYYPTKVDAASILLVSAKFYHSEVKRKRSRK